MEILGPKKAYTDLLDEAITSRLLEEKKEGRKYHPLRPSNAGKCARQLAYELMEYRGHENYDIPILKPHIDRLFKLGNSVEFASLQGFKQILTFNIKYKQQTVTLFDLDRGLPELSKERVEGSMDLVLISSDTKGVLDIKSKKDSYSVAYKTKWDDELDRFSKMRSLYQFSENAFYADNLGSLLEELGEDYLIENLLQLNMYANSDFLKERGIDHGAIYRYNKNDSRHMEIRFRPCSEVFQYIKEKFNEINIAVDLKKPEKIEKNYIPGSMHCAFCPFAKQCWGDINTLKSWFKTFPFRVFPILLEKTANAKAYKTLFNDYLSFSKLNKKQKEIEMAILKLMLEEKLEKIKLKTGEVFEAKFLKSPKEHFELRRTKI